MKREDPVLEIFELIGSVIRMNRIHLYQAAEPRRTLDLKNRVRLQAARSKWVTGERFIVGRAKHVRICPVERRYRAEFVRTAWLGCSDRG